MKKTTYQVTAIDGESRQDRGTVSAVHPKQAFYRLAEAESLAGWYFGYHADGSAYLQDPDNPTRRIDADPVLAD